MAIQPVEARQLSKKELRIVEDLERKIDEHIRKNYNPDGERLKCNLGEGYQVVPKVRVALVEHYRAAGWEASIQRYSDTYCIFLRPKK